MPRSLAATRSTGDWIRLLGLGVAAAIGIFLLLQAVLRELAAGDRSPS